MSMLSSNSSVFFNLLVKNDGKQQQRAVSVLENLESKPWELDPNRYLAVMAASRQVPKLFASQEASGKKLVEWLNSGNKLRCSELPALACGLLMRAHQHLDVWPAEFVQAYLEDSFGARMWVDHPSSAARQFSANILTIFNRPGDNHNIDGVFVKRRYHNDLIRRQISKYCEDTARYQLSTEHNVLQVIQTIGKLAYVQELRKVALECVDEWMSEKELKSSAQTTVWAVLEHCDAANATDRAVIERLLTQAAAWRAESSAATASWARFEAAVHTAVHRSVPTCVYVLRRALLSGERAVLAVAVRALRTALPRTWPVLVVRAIHHAVQQIDAQYRAAPGDDDSDGLLLDSVGEWRAAIDDAAASASLPSGSLKSERSSTASTGVAVKQEQTSGAMKVDDGSSDDGEIELELEGGQVTVNRDAVPFDQAAHDARAATKALRDVRSRRRLYASMSALAHTLGAEVGHVCELLVRGVPRALCEQSVAVREAWSDGTASCVVWLLLARAASLASLPAPHGVAHRQQVSFFRATVAAVQRAATAWCDTVLPRVGVLAPPLRSRALRRLLLLDAAPSSFFPDKSLTPAEQARAVALTREATPLHEQTLAHIVHMTHGASAHALSRQTALDAAHQLTKRATDAALEDANALRVTNNDLIQALVALGASSTTSAALKSDTSQQCNDDVDNSSSAARDDVQQQERAVDLVASLAAHNPDTLGHYVTRRLPRVAARIRQLLTEPVASEYVSLRVRLAMSDNPDFVLNAVCEDESSESGSSAAWLVQLLGAHAELVDRVVPVCRCVVLLHLTERMQRRVMQSRQPVTFKAPSASAAHTPHEQSVDSEQAAAHDAAIRRAVLASLRRVVQTSSDALLPACEVLAFFMQRLSAATLGWRRLANRCLLDLLVTDQSATTSLQDYNSLRWMELLANLSTSSTRAVQSIVADGLLAAIGVETDLVRLRRYCEALMRARRHVGQGEFGDDDDEQRATRANASLALAKSLLQRTLLLRAVVRERAAFYDTACQMLHYGLNARGWTHTSSEHLVTFQPPDAEPRLVPLLLVDAAFALLASLPCTSLPTTSPTTNLLKLLIITNDAEEISSVAGLFDGQRNALPLISPHLWSCCRSSLHQPIASLATQLTNAKPSNNNKNNNINTTTNTLTLADILQQNQIKISVENDVQHNNHAQKNNFALFLQNQI